MIDLHAIAGPANYTRFDPDLAFYGQWDMAVYPLCGSSGTLSTYHFVDFLRSDEPQRLPLRFIASYILSSKRRLLPVRA